MPPPATAEKIAIVGGGISALTTAYFLTDPGMAGKFDVTVYCMGWRLGGKGASGRNMDRNARIEEHGLHIWFGCYHNAIALMRRCYAELGRVPPAPLRDFDEAFKGQSRVVMTEKVGAGWRLWPFDFPPLPQIGDGTATVMDLLRRLFGWLRPILGDIDELRDQTLDSYVPNAATNEQSTLHSIGSALGGLAQFHSLHLVDWLSGALHSLDADALALAQHAWFSGALRVVARLLWDALKDEIPADDFARRSWILAYLGITFARGLLDDRLFLDGFDPVDGEELRAWLARHSSFAPGEAPEADRLAFYSPCLQSFYDASFSYDHGEPDSPNVSAAVGLRCILRILFDYSGAVVYEMQAGMGDTVFTPLYLALKKRGVTFRFFHRLTALHLDAAKTAIDSLEMSRQVTLKQEAYEPLVDVEDLPCWPNVPFYDQIVEGPQLKASGANLEHWDSGWTDTGGSPVLRRGADFDRLVLAASYDCLPFVTDELAKASPRWQQMLTGLSSAQTQACQLWFDRTRDQLGMQGGPEIFGAFVEPWSSLVDFSHLLPREEWSDAHPPQYLCYSCGTLPESEGGSDADVYARLLAFLQTDAGPLWPRATLAGGAFDWTALHASEGSVGEDRLKQQYWRTNVDPTEKYVIAKAGSTRNRLSADQSGFANMIIAGEWVDTGINISSIETTVISGMRASRAICGIPARIPGESDV
jgi:uncharacterized protein with NAD-binding domain and iron-sulfur cluster